MIRIEAPSSADPRGTAGVGPTTCRSGGDLRPFYTQQHPCYGGFDLHTRTMSRGMVNQAGALVLHRHLRAAPEPFLQAMPPTPRAATAACRPWPWPSGPTPGRCGARHPSRRPRGRHPSGPGGRGRSRAPRPAVGWRVVVGPTTLPSPRTAAGDDGRRVGRLGGTTPPSPAMGAPPGHGAVPTPPTPSVADGPVGVPAVGRDAPRPADPTRSGPDAHRRPHRPPDHRPAPVWSSGRRPGAHVVRIGLLNVSNN